MDLAPSSLLLGRFASALDLARNLRAQALDLVEGLQRPGYREAVAQELRVATRVLPRLLPWFLRARPEGEATLLAVARDHADRNPHGLAVEMEDERLTWHQLVEQAACVARVLRAHGVRPGDTLALLGPNSPMYVTIQLGATHLGAVTALINTHLTGEPLAHALRSSRGKLLLVHRRLEGALAGLDLGGMEILAYGLGPFDDEVARADNKLPVATCKSSDDFVYIYTSGTTGLPKPCKVSHGRAVMAGAVFSEMLWSFQPGDKVYCMLPLYHSSGMLLGVGASILGGVPVALRESFSARAFWRDVERYGATGFLYIGEICRHLLNTPPCEEERRHRLRVAVGNGMRADVWGSFQERFRIPLIREFYGATEAPGGIFNVTGRPGSLGRIPLRYLTPARLARYDVHEGRHLRDEHGCFVECKPGEEGELLVKLSEKPLISGFEFKGYIDEEATRQKILTDVFRKGDRYYRSGDLMRMDEDGYFYFVDRIGDTFRWKGENVSTTEVAEVLGKAPSVQQVAVVGVHVPGMEGRAGLAAVVPDGTLDLVAFQNVALQLPAYARPRFLRIVRELNTTSTHKIQKQSLRNEGVDPAVVSDPLYVLTEEGYVPLSPERWCAILEGRLRL
ncbi:MAG: AMP-binding protein [Myxococcales bacterium]|nr:AMP-binding protein [Polyangiaceae bacterium]MDW8251367.1 AMP-binding protein [Myxococcales bacterium]